MENYLSSIGKRIKELRKEYKLTINEVAFKAGVTAGLISRVENGRTTPSLPVFIKITEALNIALTDFFEGIPKSGNLPFFVYRKSEQQIIEKEDDAYGFTYKFIFGKQLNSVGFESVFLEVLPDSKRQKVVTDAFELKYVISGSCHYLIDDQEVYLEAGDALFFDGRIPHVPVNRGMEIARFLVVYFFI